jgi:hypothetical protein
LVWLLHSLNPPPAHCAAAPRSAPTSCRATWWRTPTWSSCPTTTCWTPRCVDQLVGWLVGRCVGVLLVMYATNQLDPMTNTRPHRPPGQQAARHPAVGERHHHPGRGPQRAGVWVGSERGTPIPLNSTKPPPNPAQATGTNNHPKPLKQLSTHPPTHPNPIQRTSARAPRPSTSPRSSAQPPSPTWTRR